ncbi:MAG: hypothetical protein ABL868_08165 [Sulfuriferula sp.]
MNEAVENIIYDIQECLRTVETKLNRISTLLAMPQRLDQPYKLDDMPVIENTQVFTDAEALEQAMA